MAIKVLHGLSPMWFTPPSEKGEDRPAQFKIEPLNGLEYLNVISEGESSVNDDGQVMFSTNEEGRRSILKKVTAWKNIEDNAGEVVPFSQSALKKLPTEILVQLCMEILSISNLSQEQEKNSKSQSKSSITGVSSTAHAANGDGTVPLTTPQKQSNG